MKTKKKIKITLSFSTLSELLDVEPLGLTDHENDLAITGLKKILRRNTVNNFPAIREIKP